jgi:N-acetylglucosaminyldiphosphoundecaprenol N-acetyl-beta-D-mannosaminyltransferase
MIKNSKKSVNKGLKYGQNLGINVVSASISEVLTRVADLISHNKRFTVFTPNSELVLMARKNPELRKALNSADLPIPDSVGLYYANKYLSGEKINIIPGRQLFMELVSLASQKNWKVFLLGGMGEEAELAAGKLRERYKDIKILSEAGPKLDNVGEPATETDIKTERDVVDKINKYSPELLFVAFGNPKQEIWVYKNTQKLKAKCIMTVGGAFRYIAGLAPLPPEWMEKLGLEWFWRLITEPGRLGRIFNAVIVFPLTVLSSGKKNKTT